MLFVGSIFRRRHVDRLIEAFVRRVAPQVPGSRLEIIGENRTYPPHDVDRGAGRVPAGMPRACRCGRMSTRTTLRDVYARATVFAFLSEYEGFGLTPLEALAAGVPPVVLDTPVAREIYGPAARYIARLDEPALGDALIEPADQHGRPRRACCAHADEVLARYDWHRDRGRHTRRHRRGRRCLTHRRSPSSSSATTCATSSTRACESIVGRTRRVDTTIVVVDNASTDGTPRCCPGA